MICFRRLKPAAIDFEIIKLVTCNLQLATCDLFPPAEASGN